MRIMGLRKKGICVIDFPSADLTERYGSKDGGMELWGGAFGENQSGRFFLRAGLNSKERLSRSDGYGSTSEPIADKTSGRAYQIFRQRGDGAVCGSF
jgi:hypothetical protein